MMKIYHIIPLVASILTIAQLTFAAPRLSPEARHALRDAQQLMEDKQYGASNDRLMKLITSAKAIPESVYALLGSNWHMQGNDSNAREWFIKGITAHPKNALLTANAALACYNIARFDEAGHYFEQAYSLAKGSDPSRLYQAGAAYYNAKDYINSARVLHQLLSLHTRNRSEWIQLAIHAHIGARHYKEAKAMLSDYLTQNPVEPLYWQLLAKLNIEEEQYSEAASALEICYTLRSATQQELEQLASIYTYLDAPMLAAHTLRQAYASPNTQQSLHMASLHASAGRVDMALKELTTISPSQASLQAQAVILYKARRYDQAIKTLQAPHQPKNLTSESLYYLAMAQWEKRDWLHARKNLQQIADDAQLGSRTVSPLAVLDDIEQAQQEAIE